MSATRLIEGRHYLAHESGGGDPYPVRVLTMSGQRAAVLHDLTSGSDFRAACANGEWYALNEHGGRRGHLAFNLLREELPAATSTVRTEEEIRARLAETDERLAAAQVKTAIIVLGAEARMLRWVLGEPTEMDEMMVDGG